ncbi:NAD(P)H-quinone oxidoreductase subunit 4L [Sporocytophaga myxococcoides]|uniref:NADH-quinone oxidoreductase subunit K n=1 Tax=Sporocytophaga myxococcoides TaxID=153721 RepID=A0A098L9I8_9BACT|nr:NADH-quinone oxidoreductase subunit NuoK [Sporocytophaga myxococcoides]GAL83054.1 NAD(P)H-quinone oxidoreductase subunit 4L [Sporocytophaga myxococcoides]
MIPSTHFLIIAAFLFSIGIIMLIVKRNAIAALMGIELMLNAVNINLVVFSNLNRQMDGQMFVIFVIVVAVAEAAVGLALLLQVYKSYKTSDLDKITKLKG